MTQSRTRLIGTAAAAAAAGSMLLIPAVAHADGTKDPRYSHPPKKSQPCNQKTESGGQGVTTTDHALGRSGPTSFRLTYDTRSQADRIEVFYEGRLLKDSPGLVGDNLNDPARRGEGATTVRVPAGKSQIVRVKVTGPEEGTVWSYTVHCPK